MITKNALVTRDIDLFQQLAAHRAVRVCLSITTLDAKLARVMEPRTSSSDARLRAIRELTAAGVPAHVMIGPVIPGLNDSEIPSILTAARDAGALGAAYVLLKLPTTVREVFQDWLRRSYPDRVERVEGAIRATRAGRLSDSQFGRRQVGTGNMAEIIANTFHVWHKKLGFANDSQPLNCDDFRPPRHATGQLQLF
jgi:DNA repair photolyase